MSYFLLAAGLLATAALLALEWRRNPGQQLFLRLGATLMAAMALAFLTLPPASPVHTENRSEAALWTTGDPGMQADVGPVARFVLPEAAASAPPGAVPITDSAALRRRFPTLATLHIYGDGLDPASLPALAGLHVVFHPPNRPVVDVPDVCSLHYPRTLSLGESLVVAGSVGGLPPGANTPLSLEAPDGNHTETTSGPADAHGTAPFALNAPPLAAAGRYVWKLKFGQASRPIGVCVVSPTLPRVLILEGAPHFDTAALRRWFEAAGGTLTVRTQIGKERFRYEASQGTAVQFTSLDAALLSGYDLLVVDGRSLAALGTRERAALISNLEKNGAGLLIRADEAILPPEAAVSLQDLLPGKMLPANDAPASEEHLVRPRWKGQTTASDVPVPAAPFVIERAPDQDVLIDDRRGNALVAAVRRGRGQIALTLVGDTSRWQRENDPLAFAAYWSFLFSRLSAPTDRTMGRWSIADSDTGPVFVDHPAGLIRAGSPDHGLEDAFVVEPPDGTKTPVPLTRVLSEPDTWQTTFWPRHSGWHRITDRAGTGTLDFYVDAAADWPALQATRRRLATERFAMQSRAVNPAHPFSGEARRIPPGAWFAVFLLATSYLWIERRFSRLTARP